MSRNRLEIEIADESRPYRLRDICDMCAMRAEFVVEMVEAGIVEPEGTTPGRWRFGMHAVMRLKKAQRLRRDLDLNLAGIALALDLLDDLESMRLRARALEQHLQQLLGR